MLFRILYIIGCLSSVIVVIAITEEEESVHIIAFFIFAFLMYPNASSIAESSEV